MDDLDLKKLKEIKNIAIKALFTDDELMDTFVLKGGTALEHLQINNRSSIDIDVSMETDFNLDEIRPKLEEIFKETFEEEGYFLFDFKMDKKPCIENIKQAKFWGGYCVNFKVIEISKKDSLKKQDIESLRRNAMVVGNNNTKTYKIDISKYEYCDLPKQEMDLEGYTIYVYTPLMIVDEKIRAICQQMDKYREIVETNQKQRARDFFDIYNIIDKLKLHNDFYSDENLIVLREMFKVKKVPLELINDIQNEDVKLFHESNFSSVKDTISSENDIEDFDFYYNKIVDLVKDIDVNHINSLG